MLVLSILFSAVSRSIRIPSLPSLPFNSKKWLRFKEQNPADSPWQLWFCPKTRKNLACPQFQAEAASTLRCKEGTWRTRCLASLNKNASLKRGACTNMSLETSKKSLGCPLVVNKLKMLKRHTRTVPSKFDLLGFTRMCREVFQERTHIKSWSLSMLRNLKA